MGRSDESSTLIDEVIKSQCGDQATLQAVSMYHRETGDCELGGLAIVCGGACMCVTCPVVRFAACLLNCRGEEGGGGGG